MMEEVHHNTPEGAKFSSPEEEIEYLRAQVEKKEQVLTEKGKSTTGRDEIVSEVVSEYKNTPQENVLNETHALPPITVEGIALDLDPESHDEKMNEIADILEEKGVKNAMSVVKKINSPHIDDDFHRLLVAALSADADDHMDVKETSSVGRALAMVLYEVVLPASDEKSKERTLEELISSMEQFYAGIFSHSYKKHIALELAVQHVGEEVSFYCSVPRERQELFEKHLHSAFPRARADVLKNDYNLFNYDGHSVGAHASATRDSVFALKTYEQFDTDPLSVILNAFTKLSYEGEGAAIQVLVRPAHEKLKEKYQRIIREIEKGSSVKEAIDVSTSVSREVFKEVKEIFSKSKKTDGHVQTSEIKQTAIEGVKEKISSPLASANVRLVASASSKERASSILSVLKSSFSQFESKYGGGINFDTVSERNLGKFFHRFSFRIFSSKESIPLNLKELSSLAHFPVRSVEGTREVKEAKSGTAPAPVNLPKEGVLMGTNVHRGVETPVYVPDGDRLRHLYVIGQTGTGKTTLLTNLITQDIQNGNGCCFIDPHGSDIDAILASVPEERMKDVIYFDPAHAERPMGLNMLEYDERFPEQKTFVVNELLGIFNKLFDMKTAGGPMFEQYFRNATLLVLEDPASGNTLLEIARVLADEEFRKLKLSRSNNPIVNQYWTEVAEKAGGEASLQNIVPYITSKFDGFLSNDYMRPIIAQEKSAFNFREIMDNKKILLVNLSKGRLGDINSNLIGLILIGKILMAALSRVDSLGSDLPPFYLYIDEFQNVTTDSIATILSEARKYGLSLNVAHQFTTQLEENIKNAVLGNVGSMAVYRVSSEDAELFESRFAPTFTAKDIMEQDNFTYLAKLLINGVPQSPFSVRATPPLEGDSTQVQKLKDFSYQSYGRPRTEVEQAIMKKYTRQQTTPEESPVPLS